MRLSISTFAPLWSTAAFASGIDDAARPIAAGPMMVPVLGVDVPVFTAVFAVLGVVLARPISPRGDVELTLFQTACVTAICMLLVLAWVIESKPTLLFAFIMAIGVGFSGFALIQTAGEEAIAMVRRVYAAIFSQGSKDA